MKQPIRAVFLLSYTKHSACLYNPLLLVKLRALGFGGDCIDWMRSFLEDWMFRVKLEGELSDWVTSPSVVPQGLVLGPIPFVVYINDLPEALSSPSLLFADDLKIINQKSWSIAKEFTFLPPEYFDPWGARPYSPSFRYEVSAYIQIKTWHKSIKRKTAVLQT